jgi:adenine-specific DNA-methyltransferase
MPEKVDENSEAFKAGYKTIADIGRARIQKVIEKIEQSRANQLGLEDKPPLGFNSFTLSPSNFKEWQTDIENEEQLMQQLEIHLASEKPSSHAQNMVYELLLKNGLPLTTPIQIHEVARQTVYLAQPESSAPIAMFFEQLDQKGSTEMVNFLTGLEAPNKPHRVFCLNRVFADSQAQTNFSLRMKDAGIELKVL